MAITTGGRPESATDGGTGSTTGQRTGSASYGAFKLAGLAGLLGNVLGTVGVFVDQMWTFPGSGASAGEIASFVHAHRSALLVAMILTTVAVVLWLLFGVGVWLWLREAASGGGVLSRSGERTSGESFYSMCFLVGLVSFITLLLSGFAIFFVLVYRGSEVSDPRLLNDLAFGLLAISGVPTALALGSYAAQVFRDSRLPTWSAWLAVVAAVAHLVLLASLVITSGFFSLEGGATIVIPGLLFAWITGTSGVLLWEVSDADNARLAG
jgi:hypothetical protein